MSVEVVRSACDSICEKNGAFQHILQMAVENRKRARSSFFTGPMGHYVWMGGDSQWKICNLLSCTDVATNGSEDPAVACNNDIYSTKKPKEEPAQPGYFSFFKSFISVEHDSTCRDREGIVLAIVDELSDYEILDLLIEMKKINDRSVKDVSLILLWLDSYLYVLPGITKMRAFVTFSENESWLYGWY